MAASRVASPYDSLNRMAPRTGAPVQNAGGLAPTTAPLAQRPPQQPTPSAAPGPQPGAAGGIAAKLGQVQPAPPGSQTPGGASTGFMPVTGAAPVESGTAPVHQSGQLPVPPPPNVGDYKSLNAAAYGNSGGTMDNATPGSLEAQIRGYITQNMNGGAVSPEFIQRAKNNLFSATEGQRTAAVDRINSDAARRGIFRSGIPAELAAGAGREAQSSFARGIADVLNNAENVNISERGKAADAAGNLLGMNRSWDQMLQGRFDEAQAQQRAAAAASAAANATRTYIDPETGQVSEIPVSALEYL